jgi:membrane protein YdbS with pleckstrin-like domain
MHEEKKKIYVTHVNIRLSISFMLMKLILVEFFSGGLVLISLILLYIFVKSVATLDLTVGIGVPAFFILVGIKTFITLYVILQWLNEYYEISADMIQFRRGIIFRRVDNYPTSDIKYIEVEQGPFGRALNYGTITLLNIRRVQLAQMYLIHNPLRYAQVIEEVVPNLVERKKVIRSYIHEKGEENPEEDVD